MPNVESVTARCTKFLFATTLAASLVSLTACEPEAAKDKAKEVGDLPSRAVLVAYVKQAVALNEQGKTVPRKSSGKTKADLEVPAYMHDAIAANADALAVWEDFSYSKQKEYVEWVTEAKRETTREKRIAQAVEWMAEGKPRNWKYMK